MGDFIRFIITGANDLTLALIEGGLKQVDSEFSILREQAATNSGDVIYASEVFGEIEVNRAEEEVFSEDIEDLRDQLDDEEGIEEMVSEGKATVLQTLNGATGMIAFQLTEAGHEHYRRIDPFWDWLFEHYTGLLQIDEEGYYSRDEQILFVA